MIRRWLAARSEQELRNILSEAVMVPGCMLNDLGQRCMVGAAAHVMKGQGRASWDQAIAMGSSECYRFDALCFHRCRDKTSRFGNVRITRLIHEACLRELVRRGPAPIIPVPLEEASV